MGLVDLFNAKAARSNAAPSILTFPALDTDGMARRMRLRDRAKEMGTRNLPAPESHELDAVEQDIVNEVENEGKVQFDQYLGQQKTYADRAGSLGIQTLVDQISAHAANAIVDFRNRTHNGVNILRPKRISTIEAEAELARFRKSHNLDRPARNLGPRDQKWGVLAIILLLESIANGFFLQQGSTLGLLGGIGEAMIIAGLNVAVGLGFGWFVLGWITHRNVGARILAGLGLVVYVGLALIVNMGAAHYRMAMANDPFAAAQLAIHNAFTQTLAIDVQSWLLFAFGLVFSFVAAADGWVMDDPYPGYGRVARQHRDAESQYTRQMARLVQELEKVKDRAEKGITMCLRDIDARRGEYDAILMHSQALQSAMALHFDHLETAANTLLHTYRAENAKHRRQPPPARFETPWRYARPALDNHAIPDRTRDQIDEALKRAAAEAPLRRQEVHEAYVAAMATYKKIDDLTAQDLSQWR